jgi:hypothetical protein
MAGSFQNSAHRHESAGPILLVAQSKRITDDIPGEAEGILFLSASWKGWNRFDASGSVSRQPEPA